MNAEETEYILQGDHIVDPHALAEISEGLKGLEPQAIRAAYVYDRKGFPSFDALGEGRNKSYGSNSDDIVIQVTYVVPSYSEAYENFVEVGSDLAEAKVAEEIRELERELEAEIVRHKKTQKDLDDRLKELRGS